jgi:hypothetical protein
LGVATLARAWQTHRPATVATVKFDRPTDH